MAEDPETLAALKSIKAQLVWISFVVTMAFMLGFTTASVLIYRTL